MKKFYSLAILLMTALLVKAAYVIPPSLNFAACGSYPTAYQTLGNITIWESVSTADIPGSNGSFVITCPAGFEFLAGTGSATNSSGGGNNVGISSIVVTTTTITVNYTSGGTNQADNIDISGIQIRAVSNSGNGNVNITSLSQAITGIPVNTTCANLFLYNSAPSNDAICSAKTITNGNCLSGEYTYCATSDINTGCVTAGGKTVWYQFTMSGGNTTLNLDLQTGTATIQGVQLYTNCATPSAVSSDCASPYSFTGLTSGTTYFIGVNTTSANAGTFSICATQATPSAATNDLCAGALTLPTNGTTITGTTTGAGQEINWGSCFETRDVWYTFTTPASLSGLCYTFNLKTDAASTDNVIAVCSGACGALSVLTGGGTCSGNQYVDVSSTEYSADVDWQPSTTYYVCISTSGAQNFTLTANSGATIQANDACTGAQSIQPTPVPTDNATNSCNYTYSNPSDANVTPADLCAASLENISWYVLQASGSGVISVDFTNILCNNGGGGFQLGYFSGSCGALSNINCTSASSGSITVSISGVTSGSNIYFAMDGNAGSNCHWVMNGDNIVPLPINLAEFDIEQGDKGVKVKWFTVSEINNRMFEIERSRDGKTFEKIGQVEGHGTTSLPFNYEFNDNHPYHGVNYYRLKQIDFDDKFKYSDVDYVKFDKYLEKPITVFPNPAKEELTVSLFNSSLDNETSITVTDITGRTVFTKNVGQTNNYILNVTEYAAGVYFITVQNEIARQSIKFYKE